MSESSTRHPELRKITTDVAEHYVWGSQCDGWHLVRTPSLSVLAERMPPNTSEVAHRHHVAQQFFFVLSGELVIESAGTRHVLHAREGAHVPPHVVHQALNLSAAPVEFLVISEPPSHDDRVIAD
ncbi:MAG: cupin domain-containing protein [Gemmatimonadaceae bacterium]